MTFKELGLSEVLLKALGELGHNIPTSIQEKAIPIILKKKDVLGCAQTGERVIIVMGAVNVMKPRVSGTLNKYILCIA